MSGICGIINLNGAPVDPNILRKMAEASAYRGPDGIHYWIDGNVGFAHLALNATPQSLRERQPLLSADGRVCLTADARVDNRDELIHTLTTKGYLQAKDPTDADLILVAYECWGKECPAHIIGDYAFAIWDSRSRQLLCVRDVLGVKPLHYGQVGATICLASEAQQILQHPAVSYRLNEVAIADYLVGFRDERSTMFSDVQRLPLAHRLIATQAGSRTERFWDIDPAARIHYQNDDEYSAHFLDLFERALTDRLRTQADIIGVLMSGGLDSCSIAALAQRQLAKDGSGPRLVAYSYRFDRLRSCDERVYSSSMVAELDVDVRYVDAENFWPLQAFRSSIETPFIGWDAAMRSVLDRLREQDARVLLTGQGGDALLWGSPLVYADQLAQGQVGVLWELVRSAKKQGIPFSRFARLLYTYVVRPLLPEVVIRGLGHLSGQDKVTQRAPSWIAADFAKRTGLLDRRLHSQVPCQFRSLARQAIYESVITRGSLWHNIYWHDRSAASFGIEVRHPIRDRRLAEFVLAIPPSQLYRNGCCRWIQRRAMAGILPETIRCRKEKTSFLPFLGLALQEKEVAQITVLLEGPLLGELGIVDTYRLRSTFDEYLSGSPERIDPALWYAIHLELWLRHNRQALFGDELVIRSETVPK